MYPGSYGNRRRSRSRARTRDAWTKTPQWTSLCSGQGSAFFESDSGSSSCQLCSAPSFISKVASDEHQGAPVFGLPNRTRPRSRSVNRARFRKPLPVEDFKDKMRYPRISAPQGAQKQRQNVQPQTDTSGSSSEAEPMNSPTLSRVSSTLSSDSVAELFPYDSEIFLSSNPSDPNRLLEVMKTEQNDSKEDKKHGVVALRNPNTVAICGPPRMITKMPSKIALGIPDMRASFGACIPPTPPPELSDMVEKFRAAAGIVKEPRKDVSMLKTAGMGVNVVETKLPKPLSQIRSLRSAISGAPAPSSASTPSVVLSASTSNVTPLDDVNPLWNFGNVIECSPLAVAARSMKFCCQLAHGSPTAIVSNFSSVDELFQSIADCFSISPDDIIFCTINTFKPDMDKLFSGSLEYSDMLFAHIKGQAVEVELTKTEGIFGLTVSDNGRCRSFIKRMKENSIVSRARPALAVGQLIENIDGINVTGMRHYEVVRILRNMPIGKTFILRVISPKQSGFQQIAPRSMASRKTKVNDGMRTLRFKANGGVVIEEGAVDKEMIGRLNEILDSYLGVQDDQMAQALWELALSCETLLDMNKAVRESELSVFDFPDELVFDMWGVVSDLRRKRDAEVKAKQKSNEKLNLLEHDVEPPMMPLSS